MLPESAKIVFLKKAFVSSETEIRQAYRFGIRRKAGTARASNAIIFAANQETVKMKVGPIEGDLEDIVKVGDVAVTADQHPPPDRRIDLQQHDVEPIDLRRLVSLDRHRPRVSPASPISSPRFFLVSLSGY